MKSLARVGAFLMVAVLTCAAQDPKDKLVTFEGPHGVLRGYLYKPSGEGPFPAILWNHGSEKLPGWQPELAEFFTSHRYVFFMPHRSGHGKSPGTYIMDKVNATRGTAEGDRIMIQAHENANVDVAAAASWLSQQPFVDRKRMAMVGCSFGGIQTLLSSEKGLGFKAFVAFAPAAKSWSNVSLQDRLKRAAANSQAPVFILQAANDFSTQPTKILGPIIERHGGKAKLYPAFGSTAEDGHWTFATTKQGTEIWGAEVLEFIRSNLNTPTSK